MAAGRASFCDVLLIVVLFLSHLFEHGHSSIEGTTSSKEPNLGKSLNRVQDNSSEGLANLSETTEKPSIKKIQSKCTNSKKSLSKRKDYAGKSTILDHLIYSKKFNVKAGDNSQTIKIKEPLWLCKPCNLTFESVLILKDKNALTQWLEEINKTMCCAVVLFYAKWCYFSAKLAPFYNALGRAFNSTPVLALDAYTHNGLNNRYGIVGVPTIVLFHEGRPVVRFNRSRTFKDLVEFIHEATGLSYNKSVEVSPEDYVGPLASTPDEETNYYLVASFMFITCVGLVFLWRLHYVQVVLDRLPSWTTIRSTFMHNGREKQD